MFLSEDDYAEDGSTPPSVEVLWRGELQRRFFSKPDVCNFLAESSKEKFVETVDRKLQENKLNGLLKSSRIFYREILHQELLTNMGLDAVFSLQNQTMTSWASFWLCCTINLIQLLYYTNAGPCDPVYAPEGIYF